MENLEESLLKFINKDSKLVLLFGILVFIFTGVFSSPSLALSGGEFRAGRIIDDGIFFDSSGLSLSEIQNFLNSKVPTCDTNGTQPYAGTTRGQYGASKASPPPYTCLKDYREDTSSKSAENGLCGSYSGGNKSAAQIIKDVSQSCGINPKVLVVLLEKEQALITDDWPWSIQYRSATGYGCPDSTPGVCDSSYYGFFNQVYSAARQFKKYYKDESQYSYRANRSNYIQWSPNAECGGTNIFIENQATAGLYNYTPYQPNAAALTNLYGSGDSCSAYGNRNFWRLFNDWFGSPIGCTGVDPSFIYRLYRYSDGDFLYTQNGAEICQATKYYGYTIDGPAMKSVGASDPGAQSLFRLSRNGIHFFTNIPDEMYNALQKYGYTYEGVSYYGTLVNQTGYYPVQRLSKNGRYILTTSIIEKNSYQASGYNFEGAMFNSPSSSEKVPIYRLSKGGRHLYTSSAVERALAISQNGYSDEGIGFYGLSGSTGDSLTMFRLERGGRYFYTTNINERSAALSVGYRQEVSGFFTYDGNYPGTTPVYRLSNSKNGDYLYTTIPSEKDAAVQQFGYTYEGVGFNGAP